MLTLAFLKDCRQIYLHSVESLALRLVDAHCPSKDQRYLYTQIRAQILISCSQVIYLLARRLDMSKTVDNLELGRSEKKNMVALVELHDRPFWSIVWEIHRRFNCLVLSHRVLKARQAQLPCRL
jgi:hypothetical protein